MWGPPGATAKRWAGMPPRDVPSCPMGGSLASRGSPLSCMLLRGEGPCRSRPWGDGPCLAPSGEGPCRTIADGDDTGMAPSGGVVWWGPVGYPSGRPFSPMWGTPRRASLGDGGRGGAPRGLMGEGL